VGRQAVAHRMPDCSHSVGPTSAPAQRTAALEGLVSDSGQLAARLSEQGSALNTADSCTPGDGPMHSQHCRSRLPNANPYPWIGIRVSRCTERRIMRRRAMQRRPVGACAAARPLRGRISRSGHRSPAAQASCARHGWYCRAGVQSFCALPQLGEDAAVVFRPRAGAYA
jgi:hypothetical protein